MKFDIDEITQALKDRQIPANIIGEVVRDLKKSAEDAKAHTTQTTKSKNRFAVLLYDPNNELAGKEFTASVVQTPEDDDQGLILSKISDAAKAFNQNTRKGKKNPIKTIGDALMYVTRKFFKEKNVMAKTKEPCRVLITNNNLV
jgi:hypothetical protein